jgi:hypothetical protein
VGSGVNLPIIGRKCLNGRHWHLEGVLLDAMGLAACRCGLSRC